MSRRLDGPDIPRSRLDEDLAVASDRLHNRPMRFEERELKPYAEPIPREDLKLGETYFGVQFLDQDGLVPALDPKVFIGSNLLSDDEGEFYFQDYASYRHGIRFETTTANDEAIFETGCENHIFDYEHALDVLMRCALSRRKVLGPK
jgi:hypothetical protein